MAQSVRGCRVILNKKNGFTPQLPVDYPCFRIYLELTLEANYPSVTLGNFGKNGRACNWAVFRYSNNASDEK